MTPQERVLQSYYDRLDVYSVDKSRVIGVNFQSSDPKLAAKVANAVAEEYLTLQQQAKQEQARSASKWLSGEIGKLQKKVADAEAKVAAYRTKSSLFVGTNNALLSNQQLSELNTQLATARAQKADADARANLIRAMLKSGKPIEATDVIDSDLVRRLGELRGTLMGQLAEQSSSLLGRHPRIMELKAQIADLDTQIREEARRRVHALENNAQIAGAKVQTLLSELDQLKGQAASSNELDVRLRRLERDAKSERDLLRILSGEVSRGGGAGEHQCGAGRCPHHLPRDGVQHSRLSQAHPDGPGGDGADADARHRIYRDARTAQAAKRASDWGG